MRIPTDRFTITLDWAPKGFAGGTLTNIDHTPDGKILAYIRSGRNVVVVPAKMVYEQAWIEWIESNESNR